MNPLVEFSYCHGLSHLSSTVSSYPIMKEIYASKGEGEKFVLSQGHAAAALYVVLGEVAGDAELAARLVKRFGVHPYRSVGDGIECSTGSLGMGITVALGMAMAGRTVHVLISDGECAEGSVWEVLRLAREFCNGRLKVYVNFNGMSAMGGVPFDLASRLIAFLPSVQMCYSSPLNLPFTRGLEAHYHVITDAEWESYKEVL